MTTLPQDDLARDAGILRSAAQHNRANVGVISAIRTSSLSRASLNEVSKLLLIDRRILTDSGKFSSQPGDVGSLSF
jgi:hypothetical protein